MAAPMNAICVRFWLNSKSNTKCLSAISSWISCRSCVTLNKELNSHSKHKFYSHISKQSTCLLGFDRGHGGYVTQQWRYSTLQGQLRSDINSWTTCLNIYPDIHCRHFSDQKKTDQDEQLVKKEKENIYTIPNLLTLSRIILTPAIGYLILHDSYSVALGLFTYAGFSDMLDGYIARNFKNQMSAIGTALDPLADKLMITVLTVTLTMANLLPFSLAVLIIGRDALLILTGFVIRYVSLPPPKTLSRYFDVTYPTAKLIPSQLSKWNTFNQIFLVMMTLAAPVFSFVDHPLLQGLWYLTAATTFGSGVDYIINWKKSVKYLK